MNIIKTPILLGKPLMLCQDCLVVAEFDAAYHNEDKFCSKCSGQMCGCPDCNSKSHQILEA